MNVLHKKFTQTFKQEMKSKGFDLIGFYQDQAYEVIEQLNYIARIQLSEREGLLLIEAYRRRCLREMIIVMAFLLCRDVDNFIQIQKKSSYHHFLGEIFGENFDFKTLKNQCDPLYYLQIYNTVQERMSSINLCNRSKKLFENIFKTFEILEDCLPRILGEILCKLDHIYEQGEQTSISGKDTNKELRLCFLAVYTDNLCALNDHKIPFLIFQSKDHDCRDNEDPFISQLQSTDFFVLSSLTVNKKIKCTSQPLVVNFTEDELSDHRIFTEEQFVIIQNFVMTKSFELSYPKSIGEDLFFSLMKRIEKQVMECVEGEPVKGKQTPNEKEITLTVLARKRGIAKLQKFDLMREQSLIDIFSYQARETEQQQIQKIEKDYLDDEHKCIFTFGDGLKCISWLLPNEYDSVKINNFPGNELQFFEHFNLNYQALLSIQKKHNEFFVKCNRKQLAVEFLQHIQAKDESVDKQHRVVVKPLIMEDLNTNKTRFIIDVKYEISSTVMDVEHTISSFLDPFVKGEYEIQLSQLTGEKNEEKTCYLIFEKAERANFVKEVINGQRGQDIVYRNMSVFELRQGKITLNKQVYTYFMNLLNQIKDASFKLISQEESVYWEDEVTVGLLHKETRRVQKESIRLYKQQQSPDSVDLIIQAKSDQVISKIISELSIILKPKHLFQLKDSFQYLIFSHEKGIGYIQMLSISNNILIIFNPFLNRLQFYAKTTLKEIKQTIQNLIIQIQDFIDQFLVDLRFSVSSTSSEMIKYLKSKNFYVNAQPGIIHTKIRYSLLIKEREYIKENFLQSESAAKDDCQICYGTSELFLLSNCKCQDICKACLKAHVRDKSISSIIEFKDQVLCPSCSKQPISIVDMNVLFDKIFKASIDNLKANNGHRLFIGCLTPDCKGLLQIQETKNNNIQTKWECPICHHNYCIKNIYQNLPSIPLHDVHSEDITCLAQSQDVGTEALVKAGLLKQCPQCKATFSHEVGCNHLTCTSCKTHFCALCEFQEPVKKDIYVHLREKHNGHSSNAPQNMKTVDKALLEELQTKMKEKMQSNKESDDTQEEIVYKKYNITEPLTNISLVNYESNNDIQRAIAVGGNQYNPHNLGMNDIFD